jgi:hypothetical protein
MHFLNFAGMMGHKNPVEKKRRQPGIGHLLVEKQF